MSNEEINNQDEVTESVATEEETPQAVESETPVADQPATDSVAEGEQAPAEAATAEQPVEDEPVATDKSETKEKPHAEKPQKTKKASTKTPAQKRKLFSLIYYPVLALFVLLMFIFSAVDGVSGYSPSAYGDAYYTAVNAHVKEMSATAHSVLSPSTDDGGVGAVREYIVKGLTDGGFNLVTETKTERDETADELEYIKTTTDWHVANGGKQPTVTVQTTTLDADLQSSLGLKEHLVGAELSNVVAAIPSKNDKAGAVVITVRYDGRTNVQGVVDNAAFVANAMQSLIELAKSGKSYKNDIVVVFTEDLDYAYGSYAFFNLFDGLDDVVGRATAGVNLDAYGNGGTLALTDASNASLDYINAYTKVSGNTFNSSVVPENVPAALVNRDAVKAFGKIPAVQVAVLGGRDSAQSSRDTADKLSQAVAKQQAAFIKNYIEGFGNNTDKFGAEGNDKTAYFSYLDGGTVAYNDITAYVVGGLILAVLAAVIVALVLKKTFSLKNMLVALGVQLLVVISTLAAMVAAYFLVTLMLTGFGVLPIQAITRIVYSNAGIMIAFILVTVAAAFGFTTLYKKLFRVTSSDVVRGTAVLFGLVGAVMSFACPAYSFMTSWLGLLMLATLLVTVFVNKLFKQKFGMGMDRLYLFAIPVAICLPLIMAEVVALSGMLPLVLLPVLMTAFTALLGVGVPYLDRTQPLLDAVAKKLPMRTIRVERTVTEKVEDKAKRGKFTEQTFKRVEKEKVPLNYKNYFGISVVAVLGIVIALFSGGFGVTFNKTLTNVYSYDGAIYNDSLVYELDNGEQRLIVGDLMAYKFMRYEIADLEWDAVNGYYYKTVNYNVDEIVARQPSISKSGSTYTVTTFDGSHSNVTLTIPSAKSITRITLKEFSRTDGDYEGYIYEFNNEDEIVLRLPYGFDSSFTLEIEGASPSSIKYEEHRYVGNGDVALDTVDEWNKISGNADMPGLTAGIVVKQSITVSNS